MFGLFVRFTCKDEAAAEAYDKLVAETIESTMPTSGPMSVGHSMSHQTFTCGSSPTTFRRTVGISRSP